LDVEVLPYHWDNREQLIKDRRFLELLYEDLLLEVSEKLNEFHGTDHSLRYWRILVGPWLGNFTYTLFDRWCSIQQAINNHELSGTIIITDLEDGRAPNDMNDFFHLGNSHGWNHHLMSRILTNYTDVQYARCSASEIEHSFHYGTSMEIVRPYQAANLKVSLAVAFSNLSSRFTRPTDCFIINTCLRSLRDELVLQCRMGQAPQLVVVRTPDAVPSDVRCRRWVLDRAEGTGFASCLRGLIPEQMPTAYLEGFGELCDESTRRRWPRRPKVIFTGGSHYFDDVFKAWCAARTEEGAPLVIAQHGGHVGTAWSFDHDHQVAIADKFLSWGWSDPAEPKVVPFGMLKAPILPVIDNNVKDTILLVTANIGLQCSTLGSHFLSSQILEYLEDQFNFVGSLSTLARDALTVRLSAHEVGIEWEHEPRWKDRYPSVTLDDGRSPILDLIAKAKLCVVTTNGTTFLETFFMDIPTVLFWDTSRWAISESAVPYFAALEAVGVFHGSPESAASHVSAIWSDVQSWWSDDAVVDAVATFKRRYCDDPGHVLDEVRRALLSAAREVQR
jgi:putative transferase (TIGR04331 family)